MELAHQTVERIGDLVQGILDLGELPGILLLQRERQVPPCDLPQLFRDLIDVYDISPQPLGHMVEIVRQHAQLILGMVSDGLVQFALGDARGHLAQLRHRDADDAPHLDDHQQDEGGHRHHRHSQHDHGELGELLEHLCPGHIGHRGPIAARDPGDLDIFVLEHGQPRLPAADLLLGVTIHAAVQLAQPLPHDPRIAVADDGVRPGIHQEDPAGVLDLDLADDPGDGVQVHVRRGHAPHGPVRRPEHPGGAYHIGLAGLVEIGIAQHELLRVQPVLIPRLPKRIVVRPGHEGGVLQGAVRQRHIDPRRIGVVLPLRVLDVVPHLGHVHVLVLDGVPLGLQHGQCAVHPRPRLLERALGGGLEQGLALLQQCA